MEMTFLALSVCGCVFSGAWLGLLAKFVMTAVAL